MLCVKTAHLIDDRWTLILRVVRQSETASGLTCVIDAAAALEDDAEESSEVESLPLEPGRGDVVRLMNLHKAKGLEAPVVFLADPCGGVGRWADVRIIREGINARGYFQLTREFGKQNKVVGEPAGWGAYEAEEFWSEKRLDPNDVFTPLREALRWQPDNGRQLVESHTTGRNATEIGNLDNLIKHFELYNV